jgi:translation elongation factor P/translation initiation factor 5A
MKANVNEIKPGYVIEYRDRLWTLVKASTSSPARDRPTSRPS